MIKAYWWKGSMLKGRFSFPFMSKNFGDAVQPYIFKALSDKEFKYTRLVKSDIVLGGSIYSLIPSRYMGYVWGGGFIKDTSITNPKWELKSIRGEKSAWCIFARGIRAMRKVKSSKFVYGDNILLCDRLGSASYIYTYKKYYLGVAPSRVCKNDPKFLEFMAKHEHQCVKYIDVSKPPLEVIKDISRCSNIISSGLHVLVLADSLGIPNRHVHFSDNLIGGDFKFEDYYSAYGMEHNTIDFSPDVSLRNIVKQLTRKRPGINQIKKDLVEAFPY